MLNFTSNKLFRKESLALLRYFSKRKATKNATITDGKVPGLSEKCLSVPKTPVGPCAAKDKEYKNPEYFCYHVDSFGEAEVELAKYRLPAPSNKVPFKQ